MEDLATLEDYAASDAPRYQSQASQKFIFMVFGMLAGFVAMGTDWSAQGPAFWSSLWTSIAIGFAGGGVGAVLSLLADRHEYKRKFLRRLGQIFAADPEIVPAPPPTATHRLVCAAVSLRRAVGGVLYVTPGGLAFQPHFAGRSRLRKLLTRASPIIPAALEIGPPRTIILKTGRFRRPSWVRSDRRSPEVILCEWEGGVAVFVAPQVERTVSQLQRCIDALRTGLS